MGHDDHRHAPVGELAHDVEDLADELRVERGGRLVEEHELGLHRQGPRDRDPLLLTAGELPGVGGALVLEPDAVEQVERLGLHLGLLAPLDPDGALHDVLQRCHVREEVEPLEDHADLTALSGDLLVLETEELRPALRLLLLVASELAVDPDAPGLDVLELVDAPQEGRLARAGGAEQADDLTLGDVDVDALEHLVAAERLVDVDRVHERHGRHQAPFPSALMPSSLAFFAWASGDFGSAP